MGDRFPVSPWVNHVASVAGWGHSVSTWLVPGDPFLSRLTAADPAAAIAEFLQCCASRRWAAEMVARLPYRTVGELAAESTAVFAKLDWADILEALDAHPRIGDRAAGANREAAWSRAEQAAATGADGTADELRQANADYEDRFGHVFLICATGLSAETILAHARRRLANDDAAERTEVRQALHDIAALRLAKLAES
jgi:2-oxo-4-hydroxy-4-carboxy-5-ureidoimidazoline decarboxylase